MLGYVLKDFSKPTFQKVQHNVSAAEIKNGRRAYSANLTNYDKNRKILQVTNLINEAYKFVARSLYPLVVLFVYAVLFMN